MLGGLLIWGLQPGPMLFVEQKEFVWGLIASMYLGNLVGLIIVLTCVPVLAAAAGMAVPALVFMAIARNQPALHPGWAIPAATDIAFALGVLALVGWAVIPIAPGWVIDRGCSPVEVFFFAACSCS